MLCGCSPLMQGSIDTFKATIQSVEPLKVTAADVAAVPYAQILVTTPSSEGVMAKLRQQGDLQFWVASGKQVLLMRDGLVVRTIGLEPGLDGTRFDKKSPFKVGLQHVVDGQTSTRWVDMYQDKQIGLEVNSRFKRKKIETMNIVGQSYTVQRIDEEIEIPALGFSGTNHFWVRPSDGLVLQSEQYVTPGLLLRIVHLRPDWEASQ